MTAHCKWNNKISCLRADWSIIQVTYLWRCRRLTPCSILPPDVQLWDCCWLWQSLVTAGISREFWRCPNDILLQSQSPGCYQSMLTVGYLQLVTESTDNRVRNYTGHVRNYTGHVSVLGPLQAWAKESNCNENGSLTISYYIRLWMNSILYVFW